MPAQKKIGRRIYLRQLTLADATPEYCQWLNDPEVNQYLETRQSNIQQLKDYIQEKIDDPNSYFLGIFDTENDKHIGNVKLEIIKPKEKRADFGILIGNKDYWGGGIGTEATILTLDYAFNDLGLNEVELGVLTQNKRGIRTFEKAGFKLTEIKKNYTSHDGVSHDAVMMEIKK